MEVGVGGGRLCFQFGFFVGFFFSLFSLCFPLSQPFRLFSITIGSSYYGFLVSLCKIFICHFRLREAYVGVVNADLRYAVRHDVEMALWKAVYYSTIDGHRAIVVEVFKSQKREKKRFDNFCHLKNCAFRDGNN
jgi:hypothetical protein